MRAEQLTAGVRFEQLGAVYEVESVEPAEDAEPGFSGGNGLYIDGASRSHQVRVRTTTPGVSLYLDREAEVVTV